MYYFGKSEEYMDLSRIYLAALHHGFSHNFNEDKAFDNFKSFTFVRHPFMRVVSTYKDKIIDWTNYRDWRKFVGFDKNQPYMVN